MSNHEGLSSRHEDNPQEVYDSHKNEAEQLKELQRKRVNTIYSSVLTLISFQERRTPDAKEPLVTPYYEKALMAQKQAEQAAKKETLVTGEPMKKVEKIPGENPKDRKNYVYLERLDLAIERGGNKLEKRIWKESIKNFAPIIEKENIKNNTWVILKEAFDDNRKEQGLPPVEYTESDMNKDYERLRKNQIDSINSWTEYFSNKETPFPTWFKIYAFDSVIKMGTYNHKYGKYENRDKSTIAPYPKVNPAALALTLDAVNDFFGQDKEKWFTEHTDDDQLNAIVKSGNFGKIYTHFFKEIYKPIPTPERTEDIEGEWFDFYPGQEDELAEVSQGTPWCIASTQMGEHYLNTNDHTIKDNKARFKLFKLKNESSIDGMSKTACASIRFDTQGRVTEVSGLANGSNQTIQDSLVPIVEQEAFKYPLDPNQDFKEKFRDKKELIRLQDKAKEGEELTLDEYAFLYEKNREIFTLDTYGGPDLKIAELRNIYNLSRLLQGEDKNISDQDLLMQEINCVLEKASNSDIVVNFDALLGKGIDTAILFKKIEGDDISQKIDTLLQGGVKAETILNSLGNYNISQNLNALLEKNIKIETILDRLGSDGVLQNLNTLLEGGVNVETILNSLDKYDVLKNLSALLEKGADINIAFDKLNSYDIAENLNTLLEKGIDVNVAFGKLNTDGISQNINTLLEKGIDANIIFNKLGKNEIGQNLNTLLEKGIDVNVAFDRLNADGISQNFELLAQNNIPINLLISKMDLQGIESKLDAIQTDPANIKTAQATIYRDMFINGIENLILENISYDVIIDKVLDNQLDSVIKGGNLELAMKKEMEEELPDNLKTFLEQHPIDFNNIKPELCSKLVSELIEYHEVARLNDDRVVRSLVGPDLISNLDNLLQVMPIDRIVANMRPADIETYHDELVVHGAAL